MLRSTKANLILLFITLIWGMTFPLIQLAVQVVSPAFFVLVRFGIATLLFIPLILKYSFREYRLLFFAGLIIGVLSGASYLFQTIGLVTIPASRSAFITGMSVVLVPLFTPLFGLGKAKWLDCASVILCLVGIYILTGANFRGLTIGDLWTLLSALSYSFALIAIQIFSRKYSQLNLLAFYQILFALPLAAVLMPHLSWPLLLHKQVFIPILYCSIFATCVVFYLQMYYQRYTSPIKAVLIYALEPVFATFFAYLIQGTPITSAVLIGGAIIMVSTVLSNMGNYFK